MLSGGPADKRFSCSNVSIMAESGAARRHRFWAEAILTRDPQCLERMNSFRALSSGAQTPSSISTHSRIALTAVRPERSPAPAPEPTVGHGPCRRPLCRAGRGDRGRSAAHEGEQVPAGRCRSRPAGSEFDGAVQVALDHIKPYTLAQRNNSEANSLRIFPGSPGAVLP